MNLTPAGCKEQSCLQYDPARRAAVLFPERDYAAGDQVFDSYSPDLMPSELMMNHGFVDAAKMLDYEQYGAAVPMETVGE